jgi:hypothetical protein
LPRIRIAFPIFLAALLARQAARPPRAAAQTLDLVQGTVVGSPRIVGMGGVVAAAAEDMTGILATPAALAFRPPGSSSGWDWDFYLDALVAPRDTDLTNSGLAAGADRAVQAFAGGACLYLGQWGVGISGSGVSFGLPPPAAGGPATELSTTSSHVAVARSAWDGQLGVGVSLAIAEFSIDNGDQNLFSISTFTFASGATWRPRGKPWRIGVSGRLPDLSSEVSNSCGDGASCNGFVPPVAGAAPWQVGAGFAWRLGELEWNQPRPALFRDERAVVLAAEVGVIGRVADGTSVAGVAAQMAQPSGRSLGVSARAGAEWEVMPGRLRLRGGSYWEPERIVGRGGRVHGTGGLEVRLFKFDFWDKERRVRIAVAGDVARHYQNIGLSIGFWH